MTEYIRNPERDRLYDSPVYALDDIQKLSAEISFMYPSTKITINPDRYFGFCEIKIRTETASIYVRLYMVAWYTMKSEHFHENYFKRLFVRKSKVGHYLIRYDDVKKKNVGGTLTSYEKCREILSISK